MLPKPAFKQFMQRLKRISDDMRANPRPSSVSARMAANIIHMGGPFTVAGVNYNPKPEKLVELVRKYAASVGLVDDETGTDSYTTSGNEGWFLKEHGITREELERIKSKL